MSPEATRALRSALGHLESQAPEPPQLPVGAPLPTPRFWSKPAVVAVAFALAALVALPGLWWLRSGDDAVGTDASTTSTASVTSTAGTTTTTTVQTTSTNPAVRLPEAGPIFGETTGVVLLFDNGIDGLTALDPDHRLVARSLIEGQRPGDEPFSMIRVADKLVVGWGEPHAVDIASWEARSLGLATIFVPAVEPNRVWLIDYGDRIGAHTPRVWQVDVNTGEALGDPTEVTGGDPKFGIAGGLALQTDSGLVLWTMDGGVVRSLEAGSPAWAHDASGDVLVWCDAYCDELQLTDPSTLATERHRPPTGYDTFRSARLSPSGDYLAALVGGREEHTGAAIWLLNRRTGDVTVVADAETRVDFLAWTPASDQLFASSSSYRRDRTVIWRYDLDEEQFGAVVLPFGGAMTPIIVETSLASAYFGEHLVQPAECQAPGAQPSGRSGICTFAL
ncbi:MAG TPA: hypothetical protein DCY40_07040 [Actinobacteria bacterium]|nr:hypothetical protein [Actinomycetota bacterium]